MKSTTAWTLSVPNTWEVLGLYYNWKRDSQHDNSDPEYDISRGATIVIGKCVGVAIILQWIALNDLVNQTFVKLLSCCVGFVRLVTHRENDEFVYRTYSGFEHFQQQETNHVEQVRGELLFHLHWRKFEETPVSLSMKEIMSWWE